MKTKLLPAVLKTALLLSLAVPLGAAEKAAAGPQYFPMPSTGEAPLPFSEAVRSGDMLYVSGQLGVVPGTMTLAAGGMGSEGRQALDNLKAVLEQHGTSLEHVVKCTVFLADIRDWPEFNVIYREYFKTNLPARSALAASGLALDARVEVECIAYVPPAPPRPAK